MTYYNVMLLENGKKRYKFEKSFFLRSQAEIYAEGILNDPILKNIYVSYKIITSKGKRY